MGCCTSLLYDSDWAIKTAAKGLLTLIGYHMTSSEGFGGRGFFFWGLTLLSCLNCLGPGPLSSKPSHWPARAR
jgi:hypothetical protein